MQDTLRDPVSQGPNPNFWQELEVAMHLLHSKSKEPIAKGWRKFPQSIEALRKGIAHGENLALQMGEPSKTRHGYLHALDADLRDPSKRADLDRALNAALPESARCFLVKTGSGTGHHYLFFAPEPLPSHTLAKGDGWELALKGTGTYIVAPGSIHPSGGRYEWVSQKRLDPLTLDLLGEPPKVQLRSLRKPARIINSAPREPIDREDLTAALGQLDPSKLCHDEWRDAGMALHFESGGAEWGFELFNEWSSTDPRTKEDGGYPGRATLETRWRSFGGTRGPSITGATLLAMGNDAARGRRVKEWLEGLDDLPELLNGPNEDVDRELDDLSALEDKPDPTKLKFLSPAQCATQPQRGYIIKGLLAPRDIVACVGAPGCGKSTLAPYLGYMVAQGRETFGQRTKQGGVFYVAAEDETGLQMRVAALHGDHGEANHFHVVAGVTNLLAKESPDLLALREAANARKPSLIIIDTLAMAFPGLEENDAAAMGRVVAVARSLTKWGAAVILIHHDTKSGDGLPRGHSLLNGALDVSLALKRDGKTVTGKLSKNRNGSCDIDILFEIEAAHLGEDEDGDSITAAICRPPADDFAEIRNPKERAFMSALYSVQEREDVENVPEKALRVELSTSSALSQSMEKDAQRKAFQRIKQSLLGQGFLSQDEAAKTLKPLYPIDMCLPGIALGHAGHYADSAKCPNATGKGQLGHTP